MLCRRGATAGNAVGTKVEMKTHARTGERRAVAGLWLAVWIAAPAAAQAEAVEARLARASAAHEAGDLHDAVVALHAAAVGVEGLAAGEQRAACEARLAELAPRIDPLLGERRRIERDASAALAACAREYVRAGRPQCGEFVLRDAALLDPGLDVDAVLREATARVPDDKELHDLLKRCFHPWLDAVMMGMRGSARDDVAKKDASWAQHLATRDDAARTLVGLAGQYGAADRWQVAFDLLRHAAQIEPEATWPDARPVVDAYRASLRPASEACLAELWRGSKRTGRWQKPRDGVLVPPPLQGQPLLLWSKQQLDPPFRLQADVSLEQQPAGGGLVVGVQGKEDFFAVELNTIGMGISVYVSRTVGGERTVIGGSCMSASRDTPPAVRGAGEVLYRTMMLGPQTTLFVDVGDDRIVVSGIMGEICRVDVGPGSLRAGSYGFARIPYTDGKRKNEHAMAFSNLLLVPGR